MPKPIFLEDLQERFERFLENLSKVGLESVSISHDPS